MAVLCQISYREIAFLLNHNRASLSERLICLGTIELRSLIIVMVQRDRVPPSEQFFIEQTTSVSPCARQEHWAVRLRLGAVLKRSSQAAFRLSDLLFPGRALQDWARHRPFDHISQAAAANLDLPNLRCGGTASPPDKPFVFTGERVPPTRTSSSGLKAIGGTGAFVDGPGPTA